uniref:PHD-type domain-containing protein n=1 Tax=Chromera velia CCMP2878 TaxID=1169474 RepID=A0A0G4GXM6_9ALVE|mmetsp:Transcript_50803/g.99911  ORF Transcript_50803/g.99911 Transcript_50803/m.99911 type:complete len:475 (+) Transcript_50803:217-1641(+)|eukprot:Cvel_790.t1-p1 / transcript=Cvel_790.t1 / gene=Cvel_790 / organism=Chromera_velia_CCMP2878 / gene_product=hypothetical protein / transcript_product=hypothetical protein / location=Cvel_scaffold24:144764-151717(-) / protein_length=474 / sequence_SO=supercontig / SO=protein_coding / is_pseudo=false
MSARLRVLDGDLTPRRQWRLLEGGGQLSADDDGEYVCEDCRGDGDWHTCSWCKRAFHPECVGVDFNPELNCDWLCRQCDIQNSLAARNLVETPHSVEELLDDEGLRLFFPEALAEREREREREKERESDAKARETEREAAEGGTKRGLGADTSGPSSSSVRASKIAKTEAAAQPAAAVFSAAALLTSNGVPSQGAGVEGAAGLALPLQGSLGTAAAAVVGMTGVDKEKEKPVLTATRESERLRTMGFTHAAAAQAHAQSARRKERAELKKEREKEKEVMNNKMGWISVSGGNQVQKLPAIFFTDEGARRGEKLRSLLPRKVFSARAFDEAATKRRLVNPYSGAIASRSELVDFMRHFAAVWRDKMTVCQRPRPHGMRIPFSTDFALQLLAQEGYQPRRAINRVLESSPQELQAALSMPRRPYLNKWESGDRRGQIPTCPFPLFTKDTQLPAAGRELRRTKRRIFDPNGGGMASD